MTTRSRGAGAGSAILLLVPALALTQAPPAARPASGLTITFLANEGVLLSGGGQKVLIDGLFRAYGPEFALPPDSVRRPLEGGRAPFDAIDLILVTHRHGDHFHPGAVAAHLRANPAALFLAPTQVVDSLRRGSAGGPALGARLHARALAFPARQSEVVGGVRVELLGLPHGGSSRNRLEVEHLGYIVEIGGRRVLHVGDTGGGNDDFEAFRLDTARIDVALLPQWMVASRAGQQVIERWIKPRQVIAFHVGVADLSSGPAAVRAALPEARTFVHALERFLVP